MAGYPNVGSAVKERALRGGGQPGALVPNHNDDLRFAVCRTSAAALIEGLVSYLPVIHAEGLYFQFVSSLCENSVDAQNIAFHRRRRSMSGFIKGADRNQTTLFPERLDDYIAEESTVQVDQSIYISLVCYCSLWMVCLLSVE
jgi:hypothetical protein